MNGRVIDSILLLALVSGLVACTTEIEKTSTVKDDAALRPQPEPEQPEDEPPQFDFAGEFDEAPLYAAPALETVRVQRKARKSVLRLRWSPVVDASDYEVQVARNLTFASTIFERRVERRRLTTPPLPLGLYFVRVRAHGELGEGPWSAAKAVAPTPSDRRPRADVDEPKTPAPSAPLFLRVFGLADRTFAEAPSVQVRGRATEGATVSSGNSSVVAAPAFTLTVKLKHGRNDVVITAARGDESEQAKRVIFFADPRRVQSQLAQLRTLRQQLADLRALQSEIRAASRELQGALKGAPATEAASLQSELEQIKSASEELAGEVDKAFAALQRLLE
ncbi:MAG: hypothetical protein AAF654_14080 [Myxococcota bacterium]